MTSKVRFWGVVPASGAGKRMGATTPKQYLEVKGKPILQHTLEKLLAVERLSAVVVALTPEDSFWNRLPFAGNPRILTAPGGKERADSVLSALERLTGQAAPDDWVLVHDAARLCITRSDVIKLMNALEHDPVGGILALPSTDTLKGVEAGLIVDTVDRSHVWRALTPQMFRYLALKQALKDALELGLGVTDEASALELKGETPRIIEGRPDNIKVTRPEDLALAAFYLEQQCYE